MERAAGRFPSPMTALIGVVLAIVVLVMGLAVPVGAIAQDRPMGTPTHRDDVACWDPDLGESVFVVHDYASPGDEVDDEVDSFGSWFHQAVEEMIEWA
jgi:hypothetical protein